MFNQLNFSRMKRTLLLAGAALLALVACNKSQTVVKEAPSSREMTFKVVAQNTTKAGELTGSILPSTYGIYAAATQKNANGLIENPTFFNTPFEQLFGTNVTPDPAAAGPDERLWHAGSYTDDPSPAFTPEAIYWPIGSVKMDFLAYAIPMADHNNTIAHDAVANPGTDWVACWDNVLTDIASQVTFYDVDTYANQVDVLYAKANGQTNVENGGTGNSVAMAFKHAQALLIFNVRINEAASGKIAIDEIGFYTPERVNAMRADQVSVAAGNSPALAALTDADVTLKTFGTFRVNNSRNELQANWMFGKNKADASVSATRLANYKMPSCLVSPVISLSNKAGLSSSAVDYGAAIAYDENKYHQLGETLLVPEQEKVNFTITYTVGGKQFFYTFNDLRGVWEMGKKYIYDLDLTMNEIVITESVADFANAGLAPVVLN